MWWSEDSAPVECHGRDVPPVWRLLSRGHRTLSISPLIRASLAVSSLSGRSSFINRCKLERTRNDDEVRVCNVDHPHVS